MCGIAGTLRLDHRPADEERVAAMTRALKHRGPDDFGTWRSGPIALGNCRLSIIGLDGSGRQPLSNEDGSVVVTYNGEIYNYRDLRTRLLADGHTFRSATDTEVLVHAYEAWGVDRFLDAVNGMFAFALWDEKRHRLVIGRDRLGIKRVYVRRTPVEIVFASEIEPLSRERSSSIDPTALDAYLALGYVPEPATIWSDIRLVQPGTVEIWEGDGASAMTYWRLTEKLSSVPEAEAVHLVVDSVRAAVHRQLVSDVPVGILLSGGVDSLAVAAAASQVQPAPVAFTVGFADSDFDETARAAETARELGLVHYAERLDPFDWEETVTTVRHFGQPFADSSALAVSRIAKVAATHVKVVLTGDGGDELFAGYETYSADTLARFYRRLPIGVAQAAARVSQRLPVGHGRLGLRERARRFTAVARRPALEAHAYWREYFGPEERHRLLGRRLEGRDGADDLLAPAMEVADGFVGLNRYLAFDTMSYLPSDMLYKVDIATMMHSLEARVPLLDHEVVQLAFSLEPGLKRRGRSGKRILKAAVAEMAPKQLLRGPKRGLNIPMAQWLAGPLSPRLNELLEPGIGSAASFFDVSYVNELRREHQERAADHSHKLWALMAFAIWYDGLRQDN